MNEALLSTLVIVDKDGIGATVGSKVIAGLKDVGVLRPCRESPYTFHTDLTHDAVDSIVDELGLDECGFCHHGEPTHNVAVDHTKLTIHGKSRAARPLALCGDCALLFQTGDRDLLRDRLLEQSVELNRRMNRRQFEQVGAAEIRASLREIIERVTDETLAATIGDPYPMPPRRSGGFIVIGET
jgi:hypothetical protein